MGLQDTNRITSRAKKTRQTCPSATHVDVVGLLGHGTELGTFCVSQMEALILQGLWHSRGAHGRLKASSLNNPLSKSLCPNGHIVQIP